MRIGQTSVVNWRKDRIVVEYILEGKQGGKESHWEFYIQKADSVSSQLQVMSSAPISIFQNKVTYTWKNRFCTQFFGYTL